MKSKIMICILTLAVLLQFVGCNNSDSSAVQKEVNKNSFTIHEISERDNGYIVPDPKSVNGEANVILHSREKAGEETNYDLSFLGFKNEVFITNYEVGNITGSGKNLVLAINEGKKDNNYEYIAVLDYNQKESYLIQTDMVACDGKDEQINLCDITGDGQDEIIYSNEPNRSLIWNMYTYDQNELKKMYSNVQSAELERDGFDIELIDDYKIKVKGRDFSYDETISLLDWDYKESELESEKFGYAYKNGKVNLKEGIPAEIKFLMAEKWEQGYAEYDYFKKASKENGIVLPLRIVLGEKEIGNLLVDLKYNAKTKEMEISRTWLQKIEE
ncbi:MAG: hypothetical protein K6G64_01530 [Eubacterium sp.]|nr:hypothetical protein [Eubacterium sp.]